MGAAAHRPSGRRRGSADRVRSTQALPVLRAGGLVAIFPEGTRTTARTWPRSRGGLAGPCRWRRSYCRWCAAAPAVAAARTASCSGHGSTAGGRADHPARGQRPRRSGGGHRDHPNRAGRAGRGSRRATEHDVSARQDDRAAMAELGLDPSDFAEAPRRHPRRAGARRRRPPERRQVDAGQPHPRPSGSRRPGRPGRHPRPRRLRRAVERPPVHPRRHRRLGARRPRPAGAAVAAQAECAVRHRRRGAVRRRRVASGQPTPTRPSPACCAAPTCPCCSRPPRSTTSGSNPTRRRCGGSGSASRTRFSGLHGRGSGDLLDAILEALPESPRDDFGASRPAARAASRLSASPTSASPAC